jgi:hypothetical protein
MWIDIEQSEAHSGLNTFFYRQSVTHMSRKNINRSNKALVHWEEVLDDINTIAAEYESEGWKTIILHPGDVSTIVEEDAGFRLVVPKSELEALGELVEREEESFNEFELYRAPAEGLLMFVVTVKSSKYRQAVFFPTYYDPEVDEDFIRAVQEQGLVYTQITNLDQSHQYSFRHSDPSLFIP